jgi:hypothetical protein
MKAIRFFAAIMIFFQTVLCMAAAERDLKDVIMSVLSATGHINAPSKSEVLIRYAERNSVPIEEIGKVLLQLAEDVEPGTGYRSVILDILGDLRLKEALPLLEKVIRQEDDTMRGVAIRAIVKIKNGSELLDFAHEVLRDRQQYSRRNRYKLYRAISTWHLKAESSKRDTRIWQLVLEFFSDALGEEPDADNLKRIDEEFGDADEQYRMSYEREEVLRKVEASAEVERSRKYASEQLGKLRKLPKEKRTRMKIGKSTEE